MTGLYVHVPFCIRKCAYCDFYSVPVAKGECGSRLTPCPAQPGSDDETSLSVSYAALESYVRAVLTEASTHTGSAPPFRTLYVGGGTPSLLGPVLLERLLSGLKRALDLSGLVEATIEANPESATRELLQSARQCGITRISVGVQSLSDRELKSVGRVHDAGRALDALKLATRLRFDSISADLIIGLPGQTWQSLRNSIETLCRLGVQHLSVYCLSLEEGTPLAASPPGELPSDDDQADLFLHARSFLLGLGFVHYEISNFALPGHECVHNLNYWRGGEYLGLGPAAASHLGGKRSRNCADLAAYLNSPTGQTEYTEELDTENKAAEEAMLRLRLLKEGLDVTELGRKFGQDSIVGLIARLEGMSIAGMLDREASIYRLAPDRVLTSNPIFAEVLGN